MNELDRGLSRRQAIYRACANVSLAIFAAYVALLAYLLVTVGPPLYRDVPPNGRAFWMLQATLALAAFGTSFPTRRWVSWLAVLRLIPALAMLGTLLALHALTRDLR